MTECERIIKAGILPEKFFEEEVICGFTVTRERKKVFAVLLDILLKIDEVCKKHNIRYFLEGGTLIGAVRHGGFIPWDDDMDIAMPREDYEKFITLKDEFEYPYFLQTPYTDNGFFWSNPAVRNSNTTAVSPYFAYQPMNHGAFVDIFVIDNITDSAEGKANFEKINQLSVDNSTYMRMSNPNLDKKNLKRVEEYKRRMRDPFEVYEEVHSLAQKFNYEPAKYVTTYTSTCYGFERELFFKEDFDDVVLVDFMGYKFPVPKGYERILSIEYGDYRKLPPPEQRESDHSLFLDMDTPYTEFIKRKFFNE